MQIVPSRLNTLVVVMSFVIVSVMQSTFASNADRPPKIQMAIILDTSNSMDGLIDQARNQLWQVVNEFSTASQNDVKPVLEIALFEYGNDNNTVDNGFVRRLNTFTRELDAVSQGLFSMTTRGGSEYSGYAIQTAVNQLQWSQSSTDIKTIFIAGNESFRQGPVDYRDAIELATEKGIVINTIHAGNDQTGISDGWQAGAILAGGSYLSIDANQKVVHVVAPQDEKIAELNARLNDTYIPYGSKGREKLQRQMQQDKVSSDISSGLLARRAESKVTSFYSNSNWDLVDAINEGEISEEALTQLEPQAFPEIMKALSASEKVDFIKEKSEAREKIKQEISELGRQRSDYISEQKLRQSSAAPSMLDALTNAVKKQAQEKHFVFE